MKVTAIKQQVKRADRYSIYIDGKYAFSLSETGLLESKLAGGQEMDKSKLAEYKRLSADDKLYGQTLRYVAMRPRSEWEIRFYLERKNAPSPLIDTILNKLSIVGMIDDAKLAKAYVNDRVLFRPASRRKITAELRKKHIDSNLIEEALAASESDELGALRQVIAVKRRQTKYQDDLKLMQYLARQGFSYGDIKDALAKED
jgi:regulatory protein